MRFSHIVLGVLVALVWGVNFIAAKYGLMHFPPFLLTAIRFAIIAAALVPFVPFPRVGLRDVAMVSLLLCTLNLSLLFAGMALGLDIATTAIAGQLGVPFACLLGAIFQHDRMGKWRMSGMALSFLGIAIVAGTPNVIEHLPGFALVMLGSFCWGAANLYMKRLVHVPIMQQQGWMALLAVPQLVLLSLIFEHDHLRLMATVPLAPALGILYSAVFSTILGYGAWYYLLRHYPVSQIAPFSLLSPVFAVMSGVLVFHEPLTRLTVTGGMLTIAGVAIIVMRRPRIREGGATT